MGKAMSENDISAYDAGRMAYEDGRWAGDNPYTDEPELSEWDLGWDDAFTEANAAKAKPQGVARSAETKRAPLNARCLMQPISPALDKLQQDRALLRAALAGLIGVDGQAELEQMEAIIRCTPAPEKDKAAMINGIHALLATLPPNGGLAGEVGIDVNG